MFSLSGGAVCDVVPLARNGYKFHESYDESPNIGKQIFF